MKKKILCVDDEKNILDILDQLLAQEGFEVLLASNADEFQRLAYETIPDLIILDIMLGDKNGAQVYNDMVSKGFNRDIPVLFISGLVSPDHASSSTPGRKCALLAKPIKSDELIREINTLLNAF